MFYSEWIIYTLWHVEGLECGGGLKKGGEEKDYRNEKGNPR